VTSRTYVPQTRDRITCIRLVRVHAFACASEASWYTLPWFWTTPFLASTCSLSLRAVAGHALHYTGKRRRVHAKSWRRPKKFLACMHSMFSCITKHSLALLYAMIMAVSSASSFLKNNSPNIATSVLHNRYMQSLSSSCVLRITGSSIEKHAQTSCALL
jgi:hypothetical protein